MFLQSSHWRAVINSMDLPKLKRANQKGKITLYFDRVTEELYRMGKDNGWNTPEIVRLAAAEALQKCADQLKEQANQSA